MDAAYTTFVHARSHKDAARRGRQKVHGIALKRLLNERAAKSQSQHTAQNPAQKGSPSR